MCTQYRPESQTPKPPFVNRRTVLGVLPDSRNGGRRPGVRRSHLSVVDTEGAVGGGVALPRPNVLLWESSGSRALTKERRGSTCRRPDPRTVHRLSDGVRTYCPSLSLVVQVNFDVTLYPTLRINWWESVKCLKTTTTSFFFFFFPSVSCTSCCFD